MNKPRIMPIEAFEVSRVLEQDMDSARLCNLLEQHLRRTLQREKSQTFGQPDSPPKHKHVMITSFRALSNTTVIKMRNENNR
ncbi:hypothetical protein J6590_069428 [Homalodisca vitripennis]|nr:hypothetical protein J6590_069428 [Homalodisca vitripennis]